MLDSWALYLEALAIWFAIMNRMKHNIRPEQCTIRLHNGKQRHKGMLDEKANTFNNRCYLQICFLVSEPKTKCKHRFLTQLQNNDSVPYFKYIAFLFRPQ